MSRRAAATPNLKTIVADPASSPAASKSSPLSAYACPLVARHLSGAAEVAESTRPKDRVDLVGAGEQGLEPSHSLGRVVRDPEVLHRDGEAKAELDVRVVSRVKGGAQVVLLRKDEVVPLRPPAESFDGEVGRLGELEEVAGMPSPDRVSLTGFLEMLGCELGDRLQHSEPSALPAAEKALLEERFERVELSVTDCFGGRNGEAPGERCQAREEALLIGRQEIEAPLDGRTQRLLSRWGVAATAREHGQRSLEPLE